VDPNRSDLQKTAYHEAGHAVACYLFGLPFKALEICKKSKKMPLSHIDGKIGIGKGKNPVHDHIFMLLAGPAAESIFCGSGYLEALLKNQRDVELAMSFAPSTDFRKFYDYVREAMQDHDISRMVGDVAKKLLACGKLSSRQVKEVCESTS
jgi:hypothetical protein